MSVRNSSSYTCRQAGFTLLELLIAAAVFAIMATLAYGGLNTLINQRQTAGDSLQRLGAIQRGMNLLLRDTAQIVARPVRGPYRGDPLPALQGGDGAEYALVFSRGGWRNPLGQPRSSLQRVAWRVEEDGLVRYAWQVLDQAQDSVPVRTVIMADVQRMAVRFLDEGGEWQTTWPPLALDNQPVAADLPQAVEISLDLEDWGRVVRLIEVAAP